MKGDIGELLFGLVLILVIGAGVAGIFKSVAETDYKDWLIECSKNRPLIDCERDLQRLKARR